MERRINYKENEIVNNGWIFKYEIEPKYYKNQSVRRAIFECPVCNAAIIQQIYSISDKKYGAKMCKPCARRKDATKHGLKGHKDYSLWTNIKSRCYNSENPNYYLYGQRGIKLAEYWKKDSEAFIDYVRSLDNYTELRNNTKGLTLDRINNNGDYEIGNLRWVTMKIQNYNKRSNVQ